MVHLRGELDPVTGAKVRKRFSQEAERLRRADLHGAGGDKRSLDQRMADALETLSSYGSIYSRAEGATPAGCGCTGAHTDGSSGESAPESGSDSDGRGGGQAGDGVVSRSGGDVSRARNASSSLTGGGRCRCGSPPSADVTIVQHLDADGTEAFAEVAGGGVIPQSVLEEHFCDARITGVVFSSEGVPLWHGHAKRLATKAQMNALRARYGACGGCGADMWICQGHHVRPVLRGGPTNIDNMMLVCWACHQKIHHHGWREVPDGRGLYTIAPPERIRHGPAHAPDPPPGHRPSPPRAAMPPGAGPASTAAPDRAGQAGSSPARAQSPEPLFTLA